MENKEKYSSWLLIAILALIWGSSFILMKRGLECYTPGQVAALRMVIASACLLPFLVNKWRHVPKKKIPVLILAGWLGNGIPAFLFTWSETVISSGLAGVLNALTPLFTIIIGALFFHTTFRWENTLGVMIGLVGAVFLMILGSDGQIDWNNAAYGLLVVIATIMYGANVNIIRSHLSGLPAMLISSGALFTVGISCLFYLLGTDFVERTETSELATSSLFFVSILAIFGTAISLVLFNKLVKQSSALFASTTTYFIPIVAVAWGVLDGEVLHWQHFVGLSLILLGVYLVNKKKPVTTTE